MSENIRTYIYMTRWF